MSRHRAGMTLQDLVLNLLAIAAIGAAFVVLHRWLGWNLLVSLILAVPAGLLSFGLLVFTVVGGIGGIAWLCKRLQRKPPT